MEIELNDKFNIKDSTSKIRGVVFAYDEDGNLLFRKENMIVEEGRKFILRKVFGTNSDDKNFFDFAVIGDCTDVVTPGDTFDDIVETDQTTDISTVVKNGSFNSISANNQYIAATIPFPDGTVTNVNFDSFSVEDFKDKLEERNYFSYFIDEDELVIKCIICFNGNDNIAASTLGLVVNSEYKEVLDPDINDVMKGKKYYREGSNQKKIDAEIVNAIPKDVKLYERTSSELFSRLTFPTYYKSNNQRLTFKYYIYF